MDTEIIPEEVKSYLESLMVEAGLDKADPALKEMMVMDLYQRFKNHIVLTLAKHLEGNDLESFGRLANLDYGAAIDFIKERKPEMPRLLFEAMGEFRIMFLKQKA